MTPQHDITGTAAGVAGTIGFAALPWVADLETVLRIGSYALSLVVAAITLYQYYNIYFRKKK